jgi:hypothetical protein
VALPPTRLKNRGHLARNRKFESISLEDCREYRPQDLVRHPRTQMAAEEDARQRANDERTKQYPIDRSQKPVADARDQGQRHGMGDIGADETGDRGARVEQNESRHPEGAGTDRGERHEHPEHELGEGRQCRGPPRGRLRMPRRGQQTQQPPMRQDADRGHDKGDAQSGDGIKAGVIVDRTGEPAAKGHAQSSQCVQADRTADYACRP